MVFSSNRSEVKEMVQTVRVESHSKLSPLIRLRVEYTDRDHKFDVKRLAPFFNSRIANPQKLVRFVKRTNLTADVESMDSKKSAKKDHDAVDDSLGEDSDREAKSSVLPKAAFKRGRS